MRPNFVFQEVNDAANDAEGRGDLCPGSTIRLSHSNCGDTRRRGYITRKYDDAGSIVDLFYCHNCGESDARRPGIVPAPAIAPAPDPVDRVKLPDDVRAMTEVGIPGSVTAWAEKYRVTKYAKWSPGMGRIIMPVLGEGPDTDTNIIGYQARRAPWAHPSTPKYLTVQRRDAPMRTVVWPEEMDTKPIIVWTEDWVSAHQFIPFNGVVGAPLFGLNVSAENVLWADRLVKGVWDDPPDHVIWLDNDVKKAYEARDYLARLLRAMGRRVQLMDIAAEPKSQHIDALVNHVNDWRAYVFR